MADELARSSAENVPDTYAVPAATVSSLKSEDSTEQLICKVNNNKQSKTKSVTSKASDGSARRRLVVFLGLGQVLLGALLVGAGAMGVVKGASLSRVGAGLWAGCVAVVAGVVGVLAGINDCYGLNGGSGSSGGSSSPLLTAFLALSLLCLACGNSAAVLAATALQRDSLRARAPASRGSFEEEMQAWSPVLTDIALLIIAATHCLVSIISIYHVSKRICPCFRSRRPFDHNQFDPACKPYVVHINEGKKEREVERGKGQELCKELEGKLQGEAGKKNKEEPPEYGSANSKEKLVTRWLHHAPLAPARAARRPAAGVRKARKPPPPVVLLPAHPASTLGRMPACVMLPPRYATLPLPPAAPYAHPPLYYPVHDARMRRRRSPREHRGERRRRDGRERDSQLTRSLERIHRKRRAERERASDAQLKQTYTGLDRAYAEQFIAVCDESRHAAEQHDSLTSATSDTSHTS